MPAPPFVPYLTLNDYLVSIQDGQLNRQILGAITSGDSQRRVAESWAMGKIRNKIGHDYNVDSEFTPTLPFDFNRVYTGGSRCTIDFPDWVKNELYPFNSLVTYNGIGYIALQDQQGSEFDESFWQSLGKRHDIWHIPLPFPLFSVTVELQNGGVSKGLYKNGDKVFWNGHVYTNLIATQFLDRDEQIQYSSYASIPSSNVFPNSLGAQNNWKDEGAFQISGIYPSESIEGQNPNPWEMGDNRDIVTVGAVIDLSLFKLHSRIAPDNIPTLRVDAMKAVFSWLENVKNDVEGVSIDENQPSDLGDSISWGSSVKKQNGY